MLDSALRVGRLFTGEQFLDDHAVLLSQGRIEDVVPAAQLPSGLPVEDLGPDLLLVPGFVDAQVNGGGGVLFNEAPDLAGAMAIAETHRRFGATAMLPTFITDADAPRARAVVAIRQALAERRPGIAGIHLEGPFLCRARKGAHAADLIRPMSDADVDSLLELGLDTVLLTVAAENATPKQIRRLSDAGIIVSLGHSDASYEIASAAADAGARGITHLFNAMSQFGHRGPGLVGAALDHGALWCGLIADGHHVHAAAARVALRAKKGPARLFLISDAMPPAGAPGDTFTLSGRRVTRKGSRLTLDDGTLAGCDLTMDAAVRHAVSAFDVPLGEALRMASLYPAMFLRLDHDRGRIAPGYCGDLVLLSPKLQVEGVWIAGQGRREPRAPGVSAA
ncbi:N-acetylglucosamine-6-phosphate deacetylase [Lichenihabitans sp. Uapishka_5]|nr:N-acetylglucosamine-6-phosphate deacetylase [Lichenihabitans sp. Uapishka_5]MDX7949869.1 N-acetylglucosamine-6-phosphate deacetylase [Lichenihabitans sp. Uapishka_5]